MTALVLVQDAAPRSQWAERVRKAWGSALESIFATGRELIAAKEELPRGEFLAMIEADLPFSRLTAERLMRVARDPRLTKGSHAILLPPSWYTLFELSLLDDGSFDRAIEAGEIRPDMERKDAERLRTAQRRGERLDRTEQLAQASPAPASLAGTGRRYPVVYADPPWRFKTYTEAGKEKSPENHYPTLTAVELAALPVGALAADSAALFLWSTGGHLAEALALMAAWGFAYRSHVIWLKTNADGTPHRGTGFWFINTHELLLLGTRGDIPAPLMGSQAESVIAEPAGRHSEKPARFRALIEAYFPGVGRIELFARSAADGWDAWGNEAPQPARPK